MKKLAIIGASGHGKVIADAAQLSGQWSDIDFFDDNFPGIKSIEPWRVVGSTFDFLEKSKLYEGVIVGIGDNHSRLNKQNSLKEVGVILTTIIHPKAVVSPLATLGEGVVVMAGAVVNAGAITGDACIINSNAVVEHDCILDVGVHLSPGACLAGGCQIGRCSWLGIGCSVRQLTTITDDVVVGAGTVVVKNIVKAGVYVGNPAYRLN
ncbi:NeuD/PglB/VioB family sugar acetyltransferase [Spartinivicinus poritis]|uniref:NeuD/PglB/VioB family sugar acetyltransferase n=1 Tax=Spartinivicinus poritis TaxID=2994640 RepID=A0ABT5U7B4_9GAMM|nr:NeuD/PglB/VioB family sugar acetyltransferase [Spartinivicinus sp. A2-2]MDE1462262.1 NeuD/PglB/VioB family sugar acetyltransferase [Spartinivicinus sp. A2-2]